MSALSMSLCLDFILIMCLAPYLPTYTSNHTHYKLFIFLFIIRKISPKTTPLRKKNNFVQVKELGKQQRKRKRDILIENESERARERERDHLTRNIFLITFIYISHIKQNTAGIYISKSYEKKKHTHTNTRTHGDTRSHSFVAIVHLYIDLYIEKLICRRRSLIINSFFELAWI